MARVYSRVRRGHTERLWRSTDQLQHGDIGWELETGDGTGDWSGDETGVGDQEGLVRLWCGPGPGGARRESKRQQCGIGVAVLVCRY